MAKKWFASFPCPSGNEVNLCPSAILVEWHAEYEPCAGGDLGHTVFDRLQPVNAADAN
jgi:hypothetical protein